MATEIPIQNRVADNYKKSRLYYYALWKATLDPAYEAVARLLDGTTGPVLDVGCGAGLLTAFLRESGIHLPVRGIDLSAGKVQIARDNVSSRYADTAFEVKGAMDVGEFSGSVVMLDVLHYFTDEQQRLLLHKLASMIAPGGVLILRTTFKDNSWRYWVTVGEEVFVRLSRWIVGGDWNFPKRALVESCLAELQMPFAIWPLWGKTPFNSWLIVARRG